MFRSIVFATESVFRLQNKLSVKDYKVIAKKNTSTQSKVKKLTANSINDKESTQSRTRKIQYSNNLLTKHST